MLLFESEMLTRMKVTVLLPTKSKFNSVITTTWSGHHESHISFCLCRSATHRPPQRKSGSVHKITSTRHAICGEMPDTWCAKWLWFVCAYSSNSWAWPTFKSVFFLPMFNALNELIVARLQYVKMCKERAREERERRSKSLNPLKVLRSGFSEAGVRWEHA